VRLVTEVGAGLKQLLDVHFRHEKLLGGFIESLFAIDMMDQPIKVIRFVLADIVILWSEVNSTLTRLGQEF
jgi:hypothetical protein